MCHKHVLAQNDFLLGNQLFILFIVVQHLQTACIAISTVVYVAERASGP